MTATLGAAASSPFPRLKRGTPRRTVEVGVALIMLVLVGLLGYEIGAHRSSGGRVLVGRAITTGSQVEVRVDGWMYGFEITPNMQWYDAHGGFHDGFTPPCLRRPGNRFVWLRFGYSEAQGLHGDSWRPVDWVQCLHGQP